MRDYLVGHPLAAVGAIWLLLATTFWFVDRAERCLALLGEIAPRNPGYLRPVRLPVEAAEWALGWLTAVATLPLKLATLIMTVVGWFRHLHEA